MKNDRLAISNAKYRQVTLSNFFAGVNAAIDESLLPITNAKICYNFDFSSGVLKAGFGIETSKNGTLDIGDIAVKNIWLYKRYDTVNMRKDDRLMILSENGQIFWRYIYRLDYTLYELVGVNLIGVGIAVNYRLYGEDVIIICTDKDSMIVWDGEKLAYSVPSSPRVTSMVMHYERMFVTITGERNAIWFSDDLDPTNWNTDIDSGGFIEMLDERGALNKVVSYLNYIYIFRDYGITRLSAYAEQAEFSVNNLFVSSGKILADSICLCGDVIMFMAQDGLYQFDGMSTRKVLRNIAPLFLTSEATACYHNGKYFLACKMKFDSFAVGCEKSEYVNNTLIVYDIAANSYSVTRGVDLKKLVSITIGDDSCILCINRQGKLGEILENCGEAFGEVLPKKWIVGSTDLGSGKLKLIKEIYINTRRDIKITVVTDIKRKDFFIKGMDTVSKVRINMLGRLIGFEFSSDLKDAYVSKPNIVFAVIN